MILCSRIQPRPDFTYTKNLRTQNLHGMDLQGQSAICLRCFGPRVGPESWAFKQLTHFPHFFFFEILLLPALLLYLAPRVALFSEREPWAFFFLRAPANFIFKAMQLLRPFWHEVFARFDSSLTASWRGRLGGHRARKGRPQCCRSGKGPAP